MEELKILVGMVAELPNMALWVIGGYFLYKIIIIGSIFGVVKLGINKLHGVLTKSKEATIEVFTWPHRSGATSVRLISDAADNLERILKQIKTKRLSIISDYIHECSIEWLQEAVTEKEIRDEEEKRAADIETAKNKRAS